MNLVSGLLAIFGASFAVAVVLDRISRDDFKAMVKNYLYSGLNRSPESLHSIQIQIYSYYENYIYFFNSKRSALSSAIIFLSVTTITFISCYFFSGWLVPGQIARLMSDHRPVAIAGFLVCALLSFVAYALSTSVSRYFIRMSNMHGGLKDYIFLISSDLALTIFTFIVVFSAYGIMAVGWGRNMDNIKILLIDASQKNGMSTYIELNSLEYYPLVGLIKDGKFDQDFAKIFNPIESDSTTCGIIPKGIMASGALADAREALRRSSTEGTHDPLPLVDLRSYCETIGSRYWIVEYSPFEFARSYVSAYKVAAGASFNFFGALLSSNFDEYYTYNATESAFYSPMEFLFWTQAMPYSVVSFVNSTAPLFTVHYGPFAAATFFICLIFYFILAILLLSKFLIMYIPIFSHVDRVFHVEKHPFQAVVITTIGPLVVVGLLASLALA